MNPGTTVNPRVIVAVMATGAFLAAIGWYHRRSRASTLQRVLIFAGMGLALVAALVPVLKETIERQHRVVQVGGRSIVLAAPPGFVMIGPERSELWKAFEASAPENGRRLVSLVSKVTYESLIAGTHGFSIATRPQCRCHATVRAPAAHTC